MFFEKWNLGEPKAIWRDLAHGGVDGRTVGGRWLRKTTSCTENGTATVTTTRDSEIQCCKFGAGAPVRHKGILMQSHGRKVPNPPRKGGERCCLLVAVPPS